MKMQVWRYGFSISRVGSAWDVFAGHWFLAAVVQVELARQVVISSGADPTFRSWTWLPDLLQLQGPNVLAAFVIDVPALILPSRAGWRRSYLGLVTFINFYVALNVLSFKVFADYFRWSFIDGASAFDAAIASSLWYWRLELFAGPSQIAAAQFRVDEKARIFQSRLRGPRVLRTVIGDYVDQREHKESFTQRVVLMTHALLTDTLGRRRCNQTGDLSLAPAFGPP